MNARLRKQNRTSRWQVIEIREKNGSRGQVSFLQSTHQAIPEKEM